MLHNICTVLNCGLLVTCLLSRWIWTLIERNFNRLCLSVVILVLQSYCFTQTSWPYPLTFNSHSYFKKNFKSCYIIRRCQSGLSIRPKQIILLIIFVQWSLCAIIGSLHILYVQGPLLCSFSDIHLTFKINPHSPSWQDMWLKPSKMIKLCIVLELSWERNFSWGGLNCFSAISSGAQLVEVARWMILYSIQ